MNYPKSLQNLIDSFTILPGVGEKAAERHALFLLDASKEDINRFAQSLLDVKEKVHHCKECGNLTEEDLCDICDNPNRDHSTICVVQSSKDILAMEKSGEFNGVYFVLNGVISPSKGIMPEDLGIDRLIEKAQTAHEIILATSTTQDGDLTAMYLGKILKEECPNAVVSRIARGLPTGGSLDYADEITLSHALSDRKQM